MSDLTIAFEEAVTKVQALPDRPDNDTLLRLYGLYKQATVGDACGRKPGIFDVVGAAKYDAWAALAGTAREEAMRGYIDLAATLGD
jgi:diazepam-binding inhibitor (GABA receptor modulating acyl-CoA-binding protein)